MTVMTQAEAAAPITFDDRPTKWLIYPAIFFMIFGMTIGFFISLNGFVFPDYFAGEYITFGRVRPVHVWGVLLLWLLSADIGLLFYIVQRLSGVRLWSSNLGIIGVALWWLALIPGTFSYPLGTNSGWEYAELPIWVGWIPCRVLFFTAFFLFAFNMFMTIANRRYEKLYVSLWYTMGTLIWTTITVFEMFFTLNMLPGGISRVNASFFYVHNLVGLIFTPMGLATTYYFLPKLSNTPIYSHRLSMVGFWTIAFFYAWIGAHHIIHGPISQWLQTTSIIFSLWLFIPVFTVIHNFFMTLYPKWGLYDLSSPIRFIIMGTSFYLITCIQGPLMALRNINEITSKTDWVIGHSHISLYGTFTFFAIAGIYYVVPVMTKKPLWSNRLANWHFTLNLFGSVPFMASLWIGGFIQGMEWANWATGSSYAEFHNNLTQLPFLDTVSNAYYWWVLRSIGGGIILFANMLFVVNIYNTVMLSHKPLVKWIPSNQTTEAAL